jgi:hypothetical protein
MQDGPKPLDRMWGLPLVILLVMTRVLLDIQVLTPHTLALQDAPWAINLDQVYAPVKSCELVKGTDYPTHMCISVHGGCMVSFLG